MNLFKFEAIAMLMAPIFIFIGIVIGMVFFNSKFVYLPVWMIAIVIVGFVAACVVIYFYVKKLIKNINSKDN